MTAPPNLPTDDLTVVRSLLAPANPVPDPSLARDEVLAGRAAVGLARVAAPPSRQPRGRFVAAGAVALVSVAALVALVLVPSGSGPETINLATGPGAKAIAAAAAATEAGRSARVLLTVTNQAHTVTATGVGDFASGSARVEITEAGAGGPTRTVTVVRTGDAIFAKLPEGIAPIVAAKPWISVDSPTLAQLTQLALGDVGAQITGAPLDALTYLRAVSGDVQIVGPDTTRGEPTTHYRGAIDPAKVAAQLPAALRPQAAAAAQATGRSLPADLWIDAQGRLRKLEVSAVIGSIGLPTLSRTAPAATANVSVELWDFGVRVDVVAPPADQVSDVGGLAGTFLGNLRHP